MKMPPMTVGYISFRILYNEGWRITGTFPTQNFCNFLKSGLPIYIIRKSEKVSLNSGSCSHTFKTFPGLWIHIITRVALGKFRRTSTDCPSMEEVLKRGLSCAHFWDEGSCFRACLFTRQDFSPPGIVFLFFWKSYGGGSLGGGMLRRGVLGSVLGGQCWFKRRRREALLF